MHADLAQPAAAGPLPGAPAAASQPPQQASIGVALAWGVCSVAYWAAAARAVAVCSSAAALGKWPVAALVLDPRVLPHTLVLLLSLELWGFSALADLTAIMDGLPAMLDMGLDLPPLQRTPFPFSTLRGLLALLVAMASWDAEHQPCAVNALCSLRSWRRHAMSINQSLRVFYALGLKPLTKASLPCSCLTKWRPSCWAPLTPCPLGWTSSPPGPRSRSLTKPGCMTALPACTTGQRQTLYARRCWSFCPRC